MTVSSSTAGRSIRFCLSTRIFLDWAAFLDQLVVLTRCLNVGLVVAANPITDSHKIKLVRIKDVVMMSRQVHEALRQPIVVLLLFGRVVESRVTQILLPIGNQELFQLSSLVVTTKSIT